MENKYYSANFWELLGWSLFMIPLQVFLLAMNFANYIGSSLFGIATITLSLLLTFTRVFDAITDPFFGFLLDRMNTPLGRYRPLMLLGYILMAVPTYIMYFHGEGHGIPMFIFLYVIYILGYTIHTSIWKAGQSIITNDPKQRPLIGSWSTYCTVFLASFMSIYVGKLLYPKYGGLTPPALQEMLLTAIIIAGIFTVLGMFAIAKNDKPEFYNKLSANKKTSIREALGVLKGNRPLQMLIVAAATDKLAQQTASNSTVNIMLYGIVIANYTMSGTMSLYTLIPNLLFVWLISRYSRKLGSKKALVGFSALGVIVSVVMMVFLSVIDPTQIGTNGFLMFIFIAIFSVRMGVIWANNAVTQVMIPDCADYEFYRSGNFSPGVISTAFSLVDKLISSLAATVVGLVVATIGYTDALPQIGDPNSSGMFICTLLLAFGMPMLGWIASLISLKFYDLTAEKMEEIQEHNAKVRAAAGK